VLIVVYHRLLFASLVTGGSCANSNSKNSKRVAEPLANSKRLVEALRPLLILQSSLHLAGVAAGAAGVLLLYCCFFTAAFLLLLLLLPY